MGGGPGFFGIEGFGGSRGLGFTALGKSGELCTQICNEIVGSIK